MSDEVSVPRSTYLLMWVGLMLPFVLVACTADADVRPVLMSPSLDDVFATTEIQLEEDPKDPIGQVGVFDEVKDGGFVLGDRILPRVRIYGPQGQLRGSVGKRGEGPFEFLVIRGVAQGPSGEILVVDPRLGRISTFLVSLQRDTTVRPTPRPRGPIAHIGSETILETAPGSRMTQLTAMTSDWRERWSVTPPSLDQVLKNPYWTSAFSMPFAASSSHLIVANSLSYPIYVYNNRGQLIDSLTKAPPTYRRPTILEPGALAGPRSGERRSQWLKTFDVIANLSVVADTLLVVTHGGLETTAASRYDPRHTRLDLYDLKTRKKVAEDVALPDDCRVLGGGSALYLLTSEPPGPWILQRLTPFTS